MTCFLRRCGGEMGGGLFFWFCEDDVDEEHDDGDVVEYP